MTEYHGKNSINIEDVKNEVRRKITGLEVTVFTKEIFKDDRKISGVVVRTEPWFFIEVDNGEGFISNIPFCGLTSAISRVIDEYGKVLYTNPDVDRVYANPSNTAIVEANAVQEAEIEYEHPVSGRKRRISGWNYCSSGAN